MSTETPPTTEAARKPGVLWDMTADGTITRLDQRLADSVVEPIARFQDGKVRFLSAEFQKYTGQIGQVMKHKGLEYTLEPFVTASKDAEFFPKTANGGAEPEDGIDGMKALTVNQRKAINQLRAKEGFPLGELERNGPPAPPQTAGAGDKTPEFVRWLLRYHPAQFCERYGVDRIGSIEVTVPGELDPVTRTRKPATRRWEGGHVIARRETIFTKVVRNQKPDEQETSP